MQPMPLWADAEEKLADRPVIVYSVLISFSSYLLEVQCNGKLLMWWTIEAMHKMWNSPVRAQQPRWRMQERDTAS